MAERVPDAAAETRPTGLIDPTSRVVDGTPTVIVDDVHLTYRISGGKRRHDPPAALMRIVTRSAPPGMREIYAIRGVSLVAHRGEAVGLIGPNGSGKSTLLRAIAGLMPPAAGNIYISGEPSLLSVGGALMEDLSGERNIELGCLAMGMTPVEIRELFDDIVAFADIGDAIALPMRTYSSGMAARLRFAIASAKTREILLIDEALATGDAQFRRKSEQRIRDLCDAAGTIFLVSHGLGVIRHTCTRVIWLERGEVQMDGPTDEVIDAYEARYEVDGRVGAGQKPR